MTEKEKCRLGLLYDANYDPEILAAGSTGKCKNSDLFEELLFWS